MSVLSASPSAGSTPPPTPPGRRLIFTLRPVSWGNSGNIRAALHNRQDMTPTVDLTIVINETNNWMIVNDNSFFYGSKDNRSGIAVFSQSVNPITVAFTVKYNAGDNTTHHPPSRRRMQYSLIY